MLALLTVQGVPPASVTGTFVVDGDGGPGIDFDDLQGAVDAVPPGSTLVLRASTKELSAVIDKELAVIGMPGVRIGAIVVRDLLPSETVVLARLGKFSNGTYSFQDCLGRIVGETLVCRRVYVSKCSGVYLRDIDVSAAGYGAAALRVEDASVDVSDGRLSGAGYYDYGEDAVLVRGSSDLTLSLLDIVGGEGYFASWGGGAQGGDAIRVLDGAGRVDVRGRPEDFVRGGPGEFGIDGDAIRVLPGSSFQVFLNGASAIGSVDPSVMVSASSAPSLRVGPRQGTTVFCELWANGFAQGTLHVGSSPELLPGSTSATPIELNGRGYGSVILDLPKTPVGEPLFVQAFVPSAPVFRLSNVVPVVTLPDRRSFVHACDIGTLGPIGPGDVKVFSGTDSTIGGEPPVAFAWDFGDGSTAVGPTVTHAYAQPGTYWVTLTTTGAGGSEYECGFNQFVNAPPVCSSTATVDPPVPGSPVSFDASGSSDPDGGALIYSWDFGDGATAQSVGPSHAYSSPGAYLVTLTVTDTFGTSTSCTTTVDIVANVAPTCAFSVGAPVGNLVRFDASGSSDAFDGIVAYDWDFGDGASATTTTPSAVHAYAQPGAYTVELTVSDAGGLSSTCTQVATAGADDPPSCAFTVTTVVGNLFLFDGGGSSDPQGPIVQYRWDFGDGTAPVAATAPTVAHSFAQPGTYTVMLTVTDDAGQTSSCSRTISAP